jgi:ribosomal protein S12 methylthiotransferase accessory factor
MPVPRHGSLTVQESDMKLELKYKGGRRIVTEVRGLEIAFDNREKYGGTNTAAEPPDVFAASVGACMGMYALGLLDRLNLPTEGFRIEVDFEMGRGPTRIASMNFKFYLPQALPSERREQFIATVMKCPLTGTLEVLPEMNLELVEPEGAQES